eukprot:363896-Chlamydomonas_euryale.AAC.8
MWTEAKRSGMPPEEGPLPSAVHEEATVVYESRCYGIAFDDAAEAAKSVRTHALMCGCYETFLKKYAGSGV